MFWRWLLASALMIAAGLVQAFLGVNAEQRGLEDVAKPVSAEEAEEAEAAEPDRGPEDAPVREPVAIDRDVEALVGAIAERGEVGRRELCRIAESRAWGPGRFRRALRKAMDDRRVRRVGRDRLTAS